MSELNGLPPRPWPTKKRVAWSARVNRALTTLGALPLPAKYAFWLTLLVLLLLAAGCATPSHNVTPSANPAPPRLSEPIPTEGYSSKVQKLFEDWLKRVTDM